jgi:hypothetical protein
VQITTCNNDLTKPLVFASDYVPRSGVLAGIYQLKARSGRIFTLLPWFFSLSNASFNSRNNNRYLLVASGENHYDIDFLLVWVLKVQIFSAALGKIITYRTKKLLGFGGV